MLLTGQNMISCKYLQPLTAIDDILSQQTCRLAEEPTGTIEPL